MVRTLPARSGSPICEYLGLLPSTLQRDGAYTPHVVSPGRNVGIETSGPIVAEIVERTLALSLPPGFSEALGVTVNAACWYEPPSWGMTQPDSFGPYLPPLVQGSTFPPAVGNTSNTGVPPEQ
jgi:hypothetical protein